MTATDPIPATIDPSADRPTSFADIIALIAALPALPPIPDEFKTAVAADATLGERREALLWLGCGQRRFPPALGTIGFALYAGPHGGVATDWVRLMSPWQDGTAPALQQLSSDTLIDLDIYELAEAPIGDTAHGPALEETIAAHAMAYGMMAVKPDLDLLVLSTIGDGETGADASAMDVIAALLKQEPAPASVMANRAALTDPLTILATLGGHESCAILGAILAARLAGYPVLIEGLPALAAALTLLQLGGRAAAALLGHVRVTEIPPNLQTAFNGKLFTLPGFAGSPACGDAAQAAALVPQLRMLTKA